VIVNRLWAEVFGRGIVDPLDDWSETTRVSHPELLDYLCQVMKATDYDVQQFMRILYHTRLFESAVAAREPDMGSGYDFRGPLLRRMKAEELYDSFIVMEFGNKDNMKNRAIKNRWETYVKSVDTLFNMPLPEIIALNKEADIREKKVRAVRAEAHKLRIQADKARGEGNTKLAAELSRKARDIYRKAKRMGREGNNMVMTMVMERNLRTKKQPFMRASEQMAPQKPGTFLRQFGSSDRMTPDASSTGASIPQVLTLLNGREVARLTDGKGVLARALRAASTPSERLDVLFLSIYAAFPTELERKRYEPLVSNPSHLTTLARAMISSKRFLFVQ